MPLTSQVIAAALLAILALYWVSVLHTHVFRRRSALPQDAYACDWSFIEELFESFPNAAVSQADQRFGLIAQTCEMDVALLEEYHIAHAIALRNQKGQASMEELHQAMAGYRFLNSRLEGVRVRPN